MSWRPMPVWCSCNERTRAIYCFIARDLGKTRRAVGVAPCALTRGRCNLDLSVHFAIGRFVTGGAPVRTFAALDGRRTNAARHHRLERLDPLCAILDGTRVLAGVHANRVARARFDAEAADDAAQLVDL